ncbi:MAG: CoA transferase [Dehalococcoidia bacterium]|nr:CoA transferase [Dehalococcoidia bacterium]
MAGKGPKLPLQGLRIIDLTAVWAGPYATRLLGDMGAEVIKIESPNNPDLLRALSLLPPGTEKAYNKAAYFNHNNRNKLGLTLDLGSDAGKAAFFRLVAKSDVVIENYRAEVMDNLGLTFDRLKQAKEDIILISMPGHGKDGPEKDFVAYGTNVEQLAGLVSVSGYIDGPPQKSGISYGDPVAGTAAAGAVIMALIARKRTGKGQYIEMAQREVLTAQIGEYVVGYSINGEVPQRLGNRHPFYAPHGCYPAAGEDRWVTIACRDDAEFATLCESMGDPDLAHDPRFREAHLRHANQDALDEIIADWTRDRDAQEIFSQLSEAGVPAGPVLNHVDLYHDRHLRERGFFQSVEHRDAGNWDMDGPAYHFAHRPTSIRMNAPAFGEHNEYILRDIIGMNDAEIAELYQNHITSDEPNMAAHQ